MKSMDPDGDIKQSHVSSNNIWATQPPRGETNSPEE